jgi:hypothetical protein
MRANLSEVVAAVGDRRGIMGLVILSVSYVKGRLHLDFVFWPRGRVGPLGRPRTFSGIRRGRSGGPALPLDQSSNSKSTLVLDLGW